MRPGEIWAVRCYRLAMQVYPRSFRARFGREMEATFTASYVAARQRGSGAVALLYLRTVVEVVGCAAFEWAERLKLRRRRLSPRERSFESATSLLSAAIRERHLAGATGNTTPESRRV